MNDPNISKRLENEKAVWHKSCRLLYTQSKVDRLQRQQEKLKKVSDIPSIDHHVYESNESEIIVAGNNVQRRSHRISKTDDDEFGESTCLLCDAVDYHTNLHSVSTLNANEKIRTAATVLNDHQLLTKLSASDLIATEAKYHLNCLTTLYNNVRKINAKSEADRNKISWFESVAFAFRWNQNKRSIRQLKTAM